MKLGPRGAGEGARNRVLIGLQDGERIRSVVEMWKVEGVLLHARLMGIARPEDRPHVLRLDRQLAGSLVMFEPKHMRPRRRTG